MAELSKDEAQEIVNEDAPLLRFVHNTIYEAAQAGNKWAILILPMADKLHMDSAALVEFGGLEVPVDGYRGVSLRTGGGPK